MWAATSVDVIELIRRVVRQKGRNEPSVKRLPSRKENAVLTANAQKCEGLTLDACEAFIREAFAGTCGRIDIHWLWSRGDMHRFRVNWWRLSPSGSEHRIARSEFVTVDMTRDCVVNPQLHAQAA